MRTEIFGFAADAKVETISSTAAQSGPDLISRSLVHGQLAVRDAVRAVGGGAEAFVAVGFVFGVVAFEENDLGVTFEREDVGGEAVEEPAVVADDDAAAGEVFQGFLEGA